MKSSFRSLALPLTLPLPLKLTLPLTLALTLALSSCRPQAPTNGSTASFNPVDTAFSNKTLVIPGGNFKVAVLFSMGDPVRVDWLDTLAAAKGAHDFLAFLPINGAVDHGILWVNHEEKKPHDLLGDGGGASVLEVFRDSLGNWKLIGTPHGVDFGPVGGTLANCLGAPTPWGTILTSE
jgi:secreted PhoX family phosphatase